MASFLAYLQGTGAFASCEMQFLQVSHTHNELDQRFSTMACKIKQAESIENMEDLKEYLEVHMTSQKNSISALETQHGH